MEHARRTILNNSMYVQHWWLWVFHGTCQFYVRTTLMAMSISVVGVKRWNSLLFLTSAHVCQSYPCPGSIAMIALLHPSLIWASFGSSWCCFRSLCTRSIHLSLGYSSRSLPSLLHCCNMLCNVRVFSSHHMVIPRKAFLGDLCGDWLDYCIAPELVISDSVFPWLALNTS